MKLDSSTLKPKKRRYGKATNIHLADLINLRSKGYRVDIEKWFKKHRGIRRQIEETNVYKYEAIATETLERFLSEPENAEKFVVSPALGLLFF